MQSALLLPELLEKVKLQSAAKKDYVANTQSVMQVYQNEFNNHLMMSLTNPDIAETQNHFGINETAHRQIATKLGIPVKYYLKLLQKHPDLLIPQINGLFNREPSDRMVRTLDGNVRAFLSNSYKRIDNDTVLRHSLPAIIKGDIETVPLSTNVTDKKMYLKILIPDERFAQEIGKCRDGSPDIVHPAFTLSNSEIGQGSVKLAAFFYRTFCHNGCTFGNEDMFSFSRTHLGSKLGVGNSFNILSDATKQKEDELIMSQVTDVIRSIASPEFSQQMGDNLRATKNSEKVINPIKSVELLCKEVGVTQDESESVIESFIADQDYSKWGMANAVTQLANRAESCDYDRASEIEKIGGKILQLNDNTWNRIAAAA